MGPITTDAALAEHTASFRQALGGSPALAARAPGRVNLIGEHTDYNEGLVLPCAIDRHTWVLAARRGDGRVRVVSRELGEAAFEAAAPRRLGAWVDYVQAVFSAAAAEGLPVAGCDLWVASDVPLGSGLSSSAALGVGVATALDALLGFDLGAEGRARLAHRGESEFVGVGCGIMDQYASALGRRAHALRIDCRSLATRAVPIADPRLTLLIAESGVRRELARGGYSDRREACRAALAAAREAGVAAPAARALRDLREADLPGLERALAPTLFRRARHVIRENARVDAFCAALGGGDLAAAGDLLRAGMASLRDDFEVSTPELDALCEAGDAHPGVYGSRLTGAGFGGCTLHLARREAAAEAAEAIARAFARRFGRRPPVLEAVPSDGAAVVTLPA